jgi:hypothetical protein
LVVVVVVRSDDGAARLASTGSPAASNTAKGGCIAFGAPCGRAAAGSEHSTVARRARKRWVIGDLP